MKNLIHISKALFRGLRLRKNLSADLRASCGLYIEEIAKKKPHDTIIFFEDSSISWQEFNELANQFADLLIKQGVRRHHCVGLLMYNCVEYLAAVIAISKIGAVAGLLNPNTKEGALVKSVESINPISILVDEHHLKHYHELKPLLSGPIIYTSQTQIPNHLTKLVCSFYDQQIHLNRQNPPDSCPGTIYEPCFYMFTSGTTGLPKAALFQTARLLGCIDGFGKVALDMKPDDRIYLTLPLYHATGLVISLGSLIAGECSLILKKSFSSSQFWPDIFHYKATCFVYIGELCRYLMNQPSSKYENNNSIKKCIGNGLRPDIWHSFKKRFDIDKVIEFYGSSEGNTAFVNGFNKDCTIGFCVNEFELIEYDSYTDTLTRNKNGFCKPVKAKEPGLAVIKIDKNAQFLGYTDSSSTQQKIITNVKHSGDQYFVTGDLLKQVDVGFCFGFKHYQFVDRLGDTFRWKGENVSTTQVCDTINQYAKVSLSTVFGVALPKTDGKAGMAAVKLTVDLAQFNWVEFSAYIQQRLPNYATPIFIRVLKHLPTTHTHKLIKHSLKEQAYHLDRNDDPIYVLKPGQQTYVKLDGVFYQSIMDAKVQF